MQHLFANRKKLIVGIIVGVMVIVIFAWRYIAVNKACPPARVEQYSLGDTVLWACNDATFVCIYRRGNHPKANYIMDRNYFSDQRYCRRKTFIEKRSDKVRCRS